VCQCWGVSREGGCVSVGACLGCVSVREEWVYQNNSRSQLGYKLLAHLLGDFLERCFLQQEQQYLRLDKALTTVSPSPFLPLIGWRVQRSSSPGVALEPTDQKHWRETTKSCYHAATLQVFGNTNILSLTPRHMHSMYTIKDSLNQGNGHTINTGGPQTWIHSYYNSILNASGCPIDWLPMHRLW
jgi:hypothetical protein